MAHSKSSGLGELDAKTVADPKEINAASQKASQPQRLFPEDLEALQPVIRELYIDKELTFKEVQIILHIQYDYIITQWNMKKNTRARDRQKILETLAIDDDSVEGRIGTVSLSTKKVKRWRKELDNSKASGDSLSSRKVKDRRIMAIFPGQGLRTTAGRTVLLPRSKIIQQPASPQNFNMTEGLVFSIDAYISGMYDPGGGWYPPDASQSEDLPGYKIASKFTGSVQSAVELLKNSSFVEARRVLSGACSLVRDMLVKMHPVTIGYMLLVFYGMTKDGVGPLADAADLLREYIGRMATVILPKNHPWRAVCCVLGAVDRNSFRQTVILSMRSLSDALEKKVGQYHPEALSIRVRYIYYAYADNLPVGEAALRKVLSGCPHPSVSYSETLTVLGALTANLREQGRYKEYEDLGKEYTFIARNYADSVAVVNGLRVTAMAQYKLGERALAEASQREAVDLNLADEKDSFNLTWAIQHLSVLESWVREWGRIDDADKIKEEIDELIKRDTAGVEDDIT